MGGTAVCFASAPLLLLLLLLLLQGNPYWKKAPRLFPQQMTEDLSKRTDVGSDYKNPVGKCLANGHNISAFEQDTLLPNGYSTVKDGFETKQEGNKQTWPGLFCPCENYRWCSGNGEKFNVGKKDIVIAILLVLLLISSILNICQIGGVQQHLQSSVSPPEVSPCPQSWLREEEQCYFFSDTEETWNFSQSNCSSYGGSLVMIDTPQQWAFVRNSKNQRYYWIGLQRAEVKDSWKWANGSHFSNWFRIGGEGLCAYLNQDVVSSTWCENHRYWICSKHLRKKT